jgi:hypothetical protein
LYLFNTYSGNLNTVNIQIPNRGRYSDSILCQSRTSHSRTIRKPDFFVRFSSLDRFIKKRVIKNILFMTKRSRLEVKKLWFGFQMVRPFKNRTFCPVLYLFCPVFEWFLTKWPPKPFANRTQKVSWKMTIWILDSPVFGGSLYSTPKIIFYLSGFSQQKSDPRTSTAKIWIPD